MKKRTKILLIAAATVLAVGATAAVAGPMIYRDFFVPEAAEKPGLTLAPPDAAENAAEEQLTADQLAGQWNVTSGSEAGYRVNEVLNGTEVTVTGRTSEVDGVLTVSNDGLTLETAEITVDVASITTDNASRDAYFRDQALNTSQHPEARFKLSAPVSVSSPPKAGESVKLEATGDLTIAGVTQEVTVELQVRGDGESTDLAGSIPITFQDFGVTAPSLGFVKVEPTGFVEFQLVAARD